MEINKMKNIKQHIKDGNYSRVYLLYGTEAYLKNLYRDKLKKGIMGNGDEMNCSLFRGKGVQIQEVVSIAQTLPFFSERRLVILENTGLMKLSNDLADSIKDFPHTTHLIFVEDEVDKRSKLYKAVKDIGTISEMNGMDENNLKLWITSILAKENKKITEKTLFYLLNKTGIDMENIFNELEKLISYTYGREVIQQTDVDAVCITQISNQIFQMIDAIGNQKPKAALSLYDDLLSLKEKPLSILFLLTRHFNILLQVKNLQASNGSSTDIAKKAGIPPFAVKKYIQQGGNFSQKQLKDRIENCIEMEEYIKTGRIVDQIAVELLIIRYSERKNGG